MRDRIARTVEILKNIEPNVVNGKKDSEVVVETVVGPYKVETGQRYVGEYAMPVFFFNLTTAYCILRSKGVPVGMVDFLSDALSPKTE